MDYSLEEIIYQKLLVPKKQQVINQLIELMNHGHKQLVKENVDVQILFFMRDLAFKLDYVVMRNPELIESDFRKKHHLTFNYSNDDIEAICEILKDYNVEYEDRQIDDDEALDWAMTWTGEYPEIEHEFFSNCWIEAKKMSQVNLFAVLFEHESFDFYDLDTKQTMDHADYIPFLESKGFVPKYYKNSSVE